MSGTWNNIQHNDTETQGHNTNEIWFSWASYDIWRWGWGLDVQLKTITNFQNIYVLGKANCDSQERNRFYNWKKMWVAIMGCCAMEMCRCQHCVDCEGLKQSPNGKWPLWIYILWSYARMMYKQTTYIFATSHIESHKNLLSSISQNYGLEHWHPRKDHVSHDFY